MPEIKVNTNELPSQVPVVPAGVYEVEIRDLPTIEHNPEKTIYRLGMSFTITADGEGNPSDQEGQKLFDRPVFLSDGSRGAELGRVQFNNLLEATGLERSEEGYDRQDFLGLRCKVSVVNRTYQDKQTGEMKEAANIKEYMKA